MQQFFEFIYTFRQEIFIVVLSIFLGIEVISNVPSVLHTPLMSGANAIHGIIIIGGIMLLGHAPLSPLSFKAVMGIAAVFLATLNVAGGFVVTDRMLEMFKRKTQKKQNNQ
ncbi:MAG TPA: NAD(P) transhydrogenase subunit alpha [Bacteroidales bacterium]|nr:NAD(P) transhydrogenase subunit alpha [Bacteroidales bacterium]